METDTMFGLARHARKEQRYSLFIKAATILAFFIAGGLIVCIAISNVPKEHTAASIRANMLVTSNQNSLSGHEDTKINPIPISDRIAINSDMQTTPATVNKSPDENGKNSNSNQDDATNNDDDDNDTNDNDNDDAYDDNDDTDDDNNDTNDDKASSDRNKPEQQAQQRPAEPIIKGSYPLTITLSELNMLKESYDTFKKQVSFFNSINPFAAIDAYVPVEKKYFNSYPGFHTRYRRTIFGLKKNDNYCDIVDAYNLAHPDSIFNQMNFFTDYGQDETNAEQETLPRLLVMQKIGNDLSPTVSHYMSSRDSSYPKEEININTTMFFTKSVDLHMYHKVGRQFLCVSQMYNHIPGHGVLKRKDLIVDSFKNYEKRYDDKPECFNEHTFFPKSFRLYKTDECNQFFNLVKSEEYAVQKKVEPIQYLAKVGYGAHRAKGVFILHEENEAKLLKAYDNGDKCGRKIRHMITQKYVANPLLLDKNNKFDFRIYMLVASTNPLIVYYHDGFLRVSLHSYSKNSSDRSVHLTNTHLSKQVFEQAGSNGKWEGMTESELREYQMWSLDRLESYLLSSGKISDPNWLENYLRPSFKKAFVHLVRMSEDSFLQHSGVFEMFGLDFMLDDKLNLWFIECNSSPQLIGTNERKTEMISRMLRDMFEIEYGLLRSRMKRVHQLMSTYHKDASTGLFDTKKLSTAFRDVNKNRFEPEYQPSSNNTWMKIIDKTLNGSDQYMGILSEECIL